MSQPCFLCGSEDLGFSLESLMVAESPLLTIVVAPRPFNSGELIVAPKRHVTALEDLTDDEILEISQWVTRVQEAMEEILHPQGINLGGTLDGSSESQRSRHVGIRVVPRWIGDTNFMPVIAGVKVLPQAIHKTIRNYRDALSKP